jgi:hypothetical protein
MMIKRVLLLGDFSAVHKNLDEGLRKIGVESICASSENAWRQLGATINFDKKIFGLPAKISRNLSPFVNYRKLINHDVVQFIHYTNNFNPRFGINAFLTKKIVESNEKVFLVSTGCDPFTHKFFTSGEYPFPQLCHECLRQDLHASDCPVASEKKENELYKFLEKTNGVIPLIYEFAEAHRRLGTANLMKTIPLPMNTDKIKFSENIVGSKLVVFHGINRVGFKGTDLVKTAMENVRNKYPNDIEVIIDGKMSLEKYLKLIERTNVVIDQTYAISYGMNAVYSMALGKVVIGGGHHKGLAEFGLSRSPMIPVQPQVKNIEEALVKLLERKHEIPAMGYDSRKYIEDVHHYERIAKKFLETWESR